MLPAPWFLAGLWGAPWRCDALNIHPEFDQCHVTGAVGAVRVASVVHLLRVARRAQWAGDHPWLLLVGERVFRQLEPANATVP